MGVSIESAKYAARIDDLLRVKAKCKTGGETLTNGNCTNPAPDGLPAQCVGQWAADKDYYLRQYIEATREVRAGYLPPKGRGGSAFIDLFAGPGVVRVRESGEIRDGSPMVAFRHEAAPFTRLVLCDIDGDNVRALRSRTASKDGRVTIIEGDCNEKIDQVLEVIPNHGLNIKNERGDKFWQSITKNKPSGQRGWGF